MFKQRFLTAVFLMPLVWFIIFYANHLFILSIIGMIVLALAWEWTNLIPANSTLEKALFLLGLMGFLWFFYAIVHPTMGLLLFLWLTVLIIVLIYPRTRSLWGKKSVLMLAAWIFLSIFALCLWKLFQLPQGRALLVYLLGIVWATDIGAYVFGKLWGRHRLIPKVSPGKTYEGVWGGFIFGFSIALLGAWYFQPTSLSIWLAQAGALISIAMLGDLWISVLKRRVQLKDTGHILPGHGGVLDRLDSLLACLPFFYFFSLSY